MELGKQTGSVFNHLFSRMTIGEPAPEVGMPATMLLWTDRDAGTVVEVNMAKRYIVVQEDKAIVVSNRGLGATEYRYEANPEGSRYYFRKGKNGRWESVYINPETKRFVKCGSRGLRLGHREKYVDPSF